MCNLYFWTTCFILLWHISRCYIAQVKTRSKTKLMLETNHLIIMSLLISRRVWRYQRGNQNPYIEEQTQWPKEKVLTNKKSLKIPSNQNPYIEEEQTTQWPKEKVLTNKKSLKIPSNQNPYIEEEQKTQWPKEKSTKGQTTIYKTYIYN